MNIREAMNRKYDESTVKAVRDKIRAAEAAQRDNEAAEASYRDKERAFKKAEKAHEAVYAIKEAKYRVAFDALQVRAAAIKTANEALNELFAAADAAQKAAVKAA